MEEPAAGRVRRRSHAFAGRALAAPPEISTALLTQISGPWARSGHLVPLDLHFGVVAQRSLGHPGDF